MYYYLRYGLAMLTTLRLQHDSTLDSHTAALLTDICLIVTRNFLHISYDLDRAYDRNLRTYPQHNESGPAQVSFHFHTPNSKSVSATFWSRTL